jgi:outer membrane receptor for ferrienterochelin and colicin
MNYHHDFKQNRPIKMKFLSKVLLLNALLMGAILQETQAQESGSYLLDMSLEDLLNMEITSVSKKSERLQDVASSIYVVNAEEIKQSGATTLHEVLRNVPGYWGMQTQYSSVYATVRNSPLPNTDPSTVLYLLDGTPIQDLMSSIFSFQNFDIPLDEIDRIEIIRGSGGSIYGANSATGVVNIFTKSPEKYDGINARVEAAAPGYIAPSVRLGGKVTDKLAISGYGKYRHFSGFDKIAGQDENGNETVANTRFTKNYDASDYFSFGAKLNYDIAEKTKISGRLHYNGRSQMTYSNSYGTDWIFTRNDILHENDVKANRLVANLRLDHSFSDEHSIFVRASTNMENDFYRVAGGMDVSNAIYDFEFQDNISVGSNNNISVGLNYRAVHFDIHNINDMKQINYIDPQANESIKGAFLQDNINILDGKLNFTVGAKIENYSLVNDNYYLSPMAKVSFIANSNLTFWGGFTKSYSTPGFNNTNIEWFLYQAPTATDVAGVAVYQALGANATEAEAQAFLASPQGQGTIDAINTDLGAALNNVAVINGSKTVPTKYETFELGLKTSLKGKVQLNSTFFLTYITDGVGASSNPVSFGESKTQPGRTAALYTYGNYVKGETMGTETMLRFFPVSDLVVEASHTWLKSNWDWQANDDFDIHGAGAAASPDTDVPFSPKHIFRLRANYSFGNDWNINAQLINTSKYRTRGVYYYGLERYTNPVELDFPPSSFTRTTIAKDDTRTIVNLRIEKSLLDQKLNIYVFGNDITNSGKIENADNLRNVTLSQIARMYGLGLNYKFN